MKKKLLTSLSFIGITAILLVGCSMPSLKKEAPVEEADVDYSMYEIPGSEENSEDSTDDFSQADSSSEDEVSYSFEETQTFDPYNITDELKNRYLSFLNGKIDAMNSDGSTITFPQEVITDDPTFRYCFYDLNKDGEAEMLTLSSGSVYDLYTINEEGVLYHPDQELYSCTEVFVTSFDNLIFHDSTHVGRDVFVAYMLNNEEELVEYTIYNHEYPDPNYSEDIEETYTERMHFDDEPEVVSKEVYDYMIQSWQDKKIELNWLMLE